MELNPGLRDAILEALNSTQSPDFTQRRNAEEKLKAFEVTDDYGVHLAHISVDPQFHLPLRQLASIVLRQYTNVHWSSLSDSFSPPEPSEGAKNSIRQMLVLGLKEHDRKVKNAIAYALASVAKWDWPDQWPDLFDIILVYLKSENADLVDGSMRVVLELANEVTDRQIPTIGPIILPEVHRIFTNAEKYHLRTREVALDTFLTLYTVICEVSLTQKSLVKTLLEPVLVPFVQALVMALQVPDGPALDNSLRAKIFHVLTSIVQNSPKQVSKLLQEIMPTVWITLVNCAEIFVKSVLNVDDAEVYDEDSNEEGNSHPIKPVMAVFDFLNALVETPKTRKFVKEAIQDVLYYLLIYMQIPNSQVEEYMESVNSYIVDEDSETFMKTVRIRALDVLLNVCKEFEEEAPAALGHAIMRLLQEATAYKNEGRRDWWKSLEVCMHSLASVAPMYVGAKSRGKNVGDFDPVAVVQSIFEDPRVRDAPPFLMGECLWAAGRLADMLPEPLKARVLKAVVEALHPSQHHVIKICGIRSVYDMCRHLQEKKQTAVLLEHLPSIIESLISFANQFPEGESLPLIMEVFPKILSVDNSFTTAAVPTILPFISDVFLKKIKDSIVVDIVEEIVQRLVKLPEVIGVVQQSLISPLLQVLRTQVETESDGSSSDHATILRLLTIIIRASPAPLSDIALQPLPVMFSLLMESDNDDTVQEGGELLRSYIVASPSQFCSYRDNEGRTGLHYALEVVSTMLSPQSSERSAMFVGRLVNTLIQRVGDQLGDSKEMLLRLVLSKLNRVEDFSVKQSLLMVFAHLVHTQLESLLVFLSTFPGPSGTSALEFVLIEWASKLLSFYGDFETKVSTVALATILQHGVLTNDSRLVSLQAPGEEIVPDGSSVRTRAQKKKTRVQYVQIPLLLKIFKVLLHLMQSELDVAMATSVEDESGDSDDEEGGDQIDDGISGVETKLTEISNLLDEIESESGIDDFENDPEARQHPLYEVNLCGYLREFITQFAAQPFFEGVFRQNLNQTERKTLQLLNINA